MRTSLRSQQYLILSVLCVLAWGLSLVNYDGIYWDDWTIVGNADDNIKATFDQAGSILTGNVHQILTGVGNGVWIYRLISFGSMWITGLLIFRLLLGLARVSSSDAFYLAALSIVYPVNQARIAIVNTPAIYSVAIFFVAFTLLTWALQARRVDMRILSLGLFLWSFEIGSLLMFYLVPIAYVLLQEQEQWIGEKGRPDLRRSCGWALRRFDIISLPVVFFVLKVMYFAPYGSFDGYNAVTLDGLWHGSWRSLWAIYQALVLAINAAVADVSFVILPLVALLAVYFRKIVVAEHELVTARHLYWGMLLVGLLLLYLAVFPYAVVGKIGYAVDWHSRHQLLTPLGGSFCLYALLRLLMGSAKSQYIAVAMSAVLLIFAHKDVVDMARYQVDWAKQESIIEQVKEIEAVRDNPGKRFLIVDNAPDYNAGGRAYRYYELSGFLRSAFNDNSRLANSGIEVLTETSFEELDENLLLYNIDPQGTDEMVGRITIESGTRQTDPTVGIYFFRLFDMDEYRRRLLDLVTLEYWSCTDSPDMEVPADCLR
jgi:hypothetical protein